jgi:hypothetical protein
VLPKSCNGFCINSSWQEGFPAFFDFSYSPRLSTKASFWPDMRAAALLHGHLPGAFDRQVRPGFISMSLNLNPVAKLAVSKEPPRGSKKGRIRQIKFTIAWFDDKFLELQFIRNYINSAV